MGIRGGEASAGQRRAGGPGQERRRCFSLSPPSPFSLTPSTHQPRPLSFTQVLQPRRRSPQRPDRRGSQRHSQQPHALRQPDRRRKEGVPDGLRRRLRHAGRDGGQVRENGENERAERGREVGREYPPTMSCLFAFWKSGGAVGAGFLSLSFPVSFCFASSSPF